MKRNIKGLRDALFDTLEKLNDKDNPLDLDRARTICSVATAITNTAKVEVQFMKETGAALESEFIASDEKPKALPNGHTAKGLSTGRNLGV